MFVSCVLCGPSFLMEKICQENRERGEEEAGEQSEERERRCCPVSGPHRRLPVVSVGTRSSGQVAKPGVVRRRRNGERVASCSGARGPLGLPLLPPRSAILSNPAGGSEVPGLAPRELLLRRLVHECPRGCWGKRAFLLQTLQPAHRGIRGRMLFGRSTGACQQFPVSLQAPQRTLSCQFVEQKFEYFFKS